MVRIKLSNIYNNIGLVYYNISWTKTEEIAIIKNKAGYEKPEIMQKLHEEVNSKLEKAIEFFEKAINTIEQEDTNT